MSDSTDGTPLCNSPESQTGSCAGRDFRYEFGGKQYCLLHFPNEGKDVGGAFTRTLNEKLKRNDYNFGGVWFPINYTCTHIFEKDADFTGAVFNGEADFSQAVFKGKVNFIGARFRQDATFLKFENEVDFNSAHFTARAIFAGAFFGDQASFYDVIFGENGGISFRNATFEKRVGFEYAQFHFGAGFEFANFKGDAIFRDACFDDYVRFQGDKTNNVFDDKHELDFKVLKIVSPDKVSFRFLRLRPHWLVHVDPRKFDFNKVTWSVGKGWWRNIIKAEIKALQEQVEFPHDLLVTLCQRLAVNHAENDYFEDASRFRYMAMAVRQQETARGWPVWKLSFWYWLASGFGERNLQAAFVLIFMWILFSAAFFYFQGSGWWKSTLPPVQGTTITTGVGDSSKPPHTPGPETATTTAGTTGAKTLRLASRREALVYSAGVMTLQKPEPQPNNMSARSLVLLATILGPVQAALLALAVRRKFMR